MLECQKSLYAHTWQYGLGDLISCFLFVLVRIRLTYGTYGMLAVHGMHCFILNSDQLITILQILVMQSWYIIVTGRNVVKLICFCNYRSCLMLPRA